MNDWPPVWVLFLTFQRTTIAQRTLASLIQHLDYPNLHYHICDDGSNTTDDGTARLHAQVLADMIPDATFHTMTTPHGQFDMGGNANCGIQLAHNKGCDLYFIVQDDVELLDDLHLQPYADVLSTHPSTGFVRFNLLVPGISGTVVEYTTPRLNCGVPFLRLIRQWSLHNPWCTDQYVNAFCPALVHHRFYDAYGYYPEGLPPGDTEVAMCAQYNDSPLGETGPQVLWPIPLWPRGIRWSHTKIRTPLYKSLTGSNGKDGRDVWQPVVY